MCFGKMNQWLRKILGSSLTLLNVDITCVWDLKFHLRDSCLTQCQAKIELSNRNCYSITGSLSNHYLAFSCDRSAWRSVICRRWNSGRHRVGTKSHYGRLTRESYLYAWLSKTSRKKYSTRNARGNLLFCNSRARQGPGGAGPRVGQAPGW